MILYNVTVKVDPEIESEWLEWMRTHHVPEVMKTGCFTAGNIFKLKFPQEDEGTTYAVQYVCADMKSLEDYHAHYAQALQREHSERYASKFVSFRTILERVH